MAKKIAADSFEGRVGQFWANEIVSAEKKFEKFLRDKESFLRDTQSLQLSAQSVIDTLNRTLPAPSSPEVIEQTIAAVRQVNGELLKAIGCVRQAISSFDINTSRLPESKNFVLDAERSCQKIHEEVNGLAREMVDIASQWRARTSQAAQICSTESAKEDAKIQVISDGIKEVTQRGMADLERKIRDLEQQLLKASPMEPVPSLPQKSKYNLTLAILATIVFCISTGVLVYVSTQWLQILAAGFLVISGALVFLESCAWYAASSKSKMPPVVPQLTDPVSEFKKRSRDIVEDAEKKIRVKVAAMQIEIDGIKVVKAALLERREKAAQGASRSARLGLISIAEGEIPSITKNVQVVLVIAKGLSAWISQPIKKLMEASIANLKAVVHAFAKKNGDCKNALVNGTRLGIGATKLPLGELKHPLPHQVANVLDFQIINIPCVFDLEGRGLTVINDTQALIPGGSVKQLSLLNSLVLHLLNCSDKSGVILHLIDPTQFGAQFEDILQVAGENPVLISGGVVSQRREIEEKLVQVSKVIEERNRVMAVSGAANYSRYVHQESAPTPFPVHVLVVASFPEEFSETALNNLQRIAVAGPRCGIFTLLEGACKFEQQNAPQFDFNQFISLFAQISRKGDASVLLDPVWDGWSFSCRSMTENDQRKLIEKYRTLDTVPESKVASLPPSSHFEDIFLPELKNQGFWESDAIHGIRLPLGVGKSGALQYFNLDNNTPHAILTGASGMGKSTLLHSMIHYAALAYPPEELGLFLADFKGSEFDIYEHRLPHARAIASTRRSELGDVLLQEIKRELDRRARLFKESTKVSGKKISEYHEYRKETGRELPRLVFILDEFQVLFTDVETKGSRANVLATLAQQARSFGVHIFLATQSLAPVATSVSTFLGQIANRIVLPSAPSDLTYVLSGESRETAMRECRERGQGLFDSERGTGSGELFAAPCFRDETSMCLETIKQTIEQRLSDAQRSIYFVNQYVTKEDTPAITECASFQALQPKNLIPMALLGVPYALEHAVTASFESKRRRNLVCAITDSDQKFNLCASVFISLLRSTENPAFLLFSDEEFKDRCTKFFDIASSDMTMQIEYYTFDDGGTERLAALEEKISSNTNKPETVSNLKQFVIVVDPTDRQISAGKFANGLRMLSNQGPQANSHVILFLRKPRDFQVLAEDQEAYEMRVCDKSTETDMKLFTNLERVPRFEKDNQELLFVDYGKLPPKVFRAFSVVDRE